MTMVTQRKTNPNDTFLTLIEENGFNALEGEKVARELRANRGLWDAVLYTRGDPGIMIRDLADGTYNADTIYLLTDIIRWKALRDLAVKWAPDSVSVLTHDDAWRADRHEDDYKLKKIPKKSRDSLSSFLGASDCKEKALITLWWD